MNAMFRKAAQKGFTLIELIITIVIIGVLAAVAIPKFQTLTSDAEQGVAAGVAAALASATSVNYARSKVPNAIAAPAAGFTYYPLAGDCTALAAAAASIADIPAGYTVVANTIDAVVDPALTADGASHNTCMVQKGTAKASFKAYGA